MSSKTIIGIVVVLVAILGTIILIHQHQADQLSKAAVDLQSLAEPSAQESVIELDQGLLPGNPSPLPRMVDLGADNCIPCKLMAPILQELKVEYAHLFFTTHFIDVWKNPAAGRQFGIRLIPTQVFYDAEGKELFRHEGFMSKQDILRQWKRMGIKVEAAG